MTVPIHRDARVLSSASQDNNVPRSCTAGETEDRGQRQRVVQRVSVYQNLNDVWQLCARVTQYELNIIAISYLSYHHFHLILVHPIHSAQRPAHSWQSRRAHVGHFSWSYTQLQIYASGRYMWRWVGRYGDTWQTNHFYFYSFAEQCRLSQ